MGGRRRRSGPSIRRRWRRRAASTASAPDLVLATGTKEAALRGADALVICTEWQAVPHRRLRRWLKAQAAHAPVIFDGRNLYDPQRVRDNGLLYFAVGRGDSVSRTAA